MILDAVNDGATKTKIMYKAMFSYNQLKGYLFTCSVTCSSI
jgi:hypothetical protein